MSRDKSAGTAKTSLNGSSKDYITEKSLCRHSSLFREKSAVSDKFWKHFEVGKFQSLFNMSPDMKLKVLWQNSRFPRQIFKTTFPVIKCLFVLLLERISSSSGESERKLAGNFPYFVTQLTCLLRFIYLHRLHLETNWHKCYDRRHVRLCLQRTLAMTSIIVRKTNACIWSFLICPATAFLLEPLLILTNLAEKLQYTFFNIGLWQHTSLYNR